MASITSYEDLEFYDKRLDLTGQNYALGYTKEFWFKPLTERNTVPPIITITVDNGGNVAIDDETIAMTASVANTRVFRGDTLYFDNSVLVVVAETTVISTQTNVPVLPVSAVITDGVTAETKALIPFWSVQEGGDLENTGSEAMGRNKIQGLYPAKRTSERDGMINLQGSLYVGDPGIQEMEALAVGSKMLYYEIRYAPYQVFTDNADLLYIHGSGPGARKGLASVQALSIPSNRTEFTTVTATLAIGSSTELVYPGSLPAPAPAPPSETPVSSFVFLSYFDGLTESQSYTPDIANGGETLTFAAAEISAVDKKYGLGCVLSNTTGSPRITINNGTGLIAASGQDFTLEFFVSYLGGDSGDGVIISNSSGDPNTGTDGLCIFRDGTGNEYRLRRGSETVQTIGSLPALGEYVHIAFVQDTTAGEQRVYFNGTEVLNTSIVDVSTVTALTLFINPFNTGNAANNFAIDSLGFHDNAKYSAAFDSEDTTITGLSAAPLATTDVDATVQFRALFDGTQGQATYTPEIALGGEGILFEGATIIDTQFGGSGAITSPNGAAGDLVRIQDGENLIPNTTSSYTFEFWVYFEREPQFVPYGVVFGNTADSPNVQQASQTSGFSITIDRNQLPNRLLIRRFDTPSLDGRVDISLGRWYHVAFVQDHVNNTQRYYVDGELQFNKTSTDQSRPATRPGFFRLAAATGSRHYGAFVDSFQFTNGPKYDYNFDPTDTNLTKIATPT